MQALAPPPCSVAAARREPCAAILQPVEAALYAKGSIAVPCDAVKADLDGVLTGRTRDTCAHHILPGHESQGTTVRPHSDPRLKSSQRLHLGSLMQTVRAGVIEFADHAEPGVEKCEWCWTFVA